MSDENPFDDVEREVEEELAKQLALVEELDQIDEDVTSWEADFIESLLRRLRNEKRALTEKQIETLKAIREKYGLEED